MPFKPRKESILLTILRFLNKRMKLNEDVQKYYLNLEKGYEGECQFDLLTEKLQNNCYILNDLLLEVNNTSFQIDTLIIYQDTIHLFDVKNYEGDYFYTPEKFHMISGKEIKNPIDQLKRCHSLLRQLLQSHGFNMTIEANVVFINPEFTLYEAPKDLPAIFPTQLNRYLKKLDTKPSRLGTIHKKLADKLVSLHQTKSPYSILPTYEYHQLKKGIMCKECDSFSMTVVRKKVKCDACGFEELATSAVVRTVEEFKLLFPERKITTKEIYEWCQIIESKKRINRILASSFRMNGERKGTFFE